MADYWKTLSGLPGICALVLISAPVSAQNVEETLNVGLEVKIGSSPTISRLDDISLSLTDVELDAAESGRFPTDEFCAFIPGATSFSIRTIGTFTGARDSDILTLQESESGDENKLNYYVDIYRIGAERIHRATNRDTLTSGINTDDLVNADIPDCGGEDNLALRTRFDQILADYAVRDLTPSQQYSFTDQLMIIIAPDI